MGRSHIADVILDPYVTVLYATPRIALIPVLILWTGIGFSLRVTVTALLAVFPIIINTYQGVRSASPNHLEVAASFNARRLQVVRTVVVPNALPYILAGLRLGAARALIGITVAEMVVGATGTGGLLMTWGRRLLVDQLFVPIIELGLLSIGLQKILMLVERRRDSVEKGPGAMSKHSDSRRVNTPSLAGTGTAALPRPAVRWWRRSSTADWALRILTLAAFLGGGSTTPAE